MKNQSANAINLPLTFDFSTIYQLHTILTFHCFRNILLKIKKIDVENCMQIDFTFFVKLFLRSSIKFKFEFTLKAWMNL